MECELDHYRKMLALHRTRYRMERERPGERISEDVCSRILYNTVYMEFGLEEAYRARELILFGRCKA